MQVPNNSLHLENGKPIFKLQAKPLKFSMFYQTLTLHPFSTNGEFNLLVCIANIPPVMLLVFKLQ